MRNKLIHIVLLFLVAVAVLQACQSENQINFARYYTSGKQLYDTHCQNCHNADGSGLGALIPPLSDTAFLSKNRSKLACIIKHGLRDSISIKGTLFSEPMPANHQLADIEIAEIVTFITNSFGNKQGLYDVSNAGSDLKNCPDLNEH